MTINGLPAIAFVPIDLRLAGQRESAQLLRRTEVIVQRNEIDLAPIHAASGIDHPEIGGLDPANRAQARGSTL